MKLKYFLTYYSVFLTKVHQLERLFTSIASTTASGQSDVSGLCNQCSPCTSSTQDTSLMQLLCWRCILKVPRDWALQSSGCTHTSYLGIVGSEFDGMCSSGGGFSWFYLGYLCPHPFRFISHKTSYVISRVEKSIFYIWRISQIQEIFMDHYSSVIREYHVDMQEHLEFKQSKQTTKRMCASKVQH
jgi:hypothetical protein